MAITRKNRSLKKKSNKSSRKSKKSRRVNKRKIRGGIWSSTVPVNEFNKETQDIEDSNESISQKVKMYINANKSIKACRSFLKRGDPACEREKYVSYERRYKLGDELLDELINSNEYIEKIKDDLEWRIHKWYWLTIKRDAHQPIHERSPTSVEEDKNSPEQIINEADFPTK